MSQSSRVYMLQQVSGDQKEEGKTAEGLISTQPARQYGDAQDGWA